VLDEIARRIGPTLLLAGSALALGDCLGLAGGIAAALRYHLGQHQLALGRLETR